MATNTHQEDDYKAVKITYQNVTDDLPNGSKHLGPEKTLELTDFEFERRDDGTIRQIRGSTKSGLDVVCWTGGKRTVRARKDDEGTYNINLGWRQAVKGVPA